MGMTVEQLTTLNDRLEMEWRNARHQRDENWRNWQCDAARVSELGGRLRSMRHVAIGAFFVGAAVPLLAALALGIGR